MPQVHVDIGHSRSLVYSLCAVLQGYIYWIKRTSLNSSLLHILPIKYYSEEGEKKTVRVNIQPIRTRLFMYTPVHSV